MISDYNWPRGAAGATGDETHRQERKRDPMPHAEDTKTPQQGDCQTNTDVQQQQGTSPRITDWASI
ncbi:MAG: hypothetical protein MUF19_01175 [Candidatus Pacebacteria bacterium]|jgi:hypothetical protein|nr:hypothetical protein [Candidatus Paceibacterota bacterium]